LDRQLRDMLADMFDPTERLESPWGSRKLTARFRDPVRPRDSDANTHMAWFVWQRANEAGAESAILEAIEAFKVSRKRMYDLWRVYKPLFEAIEAQARSMDKG
jgi:hypothetical protein